MNLVLNDVTIQSIQDIERNYSEADLLEAFSRGTLQGWLEDRMEDEVCARINKVAKDDAQGLVEALGLDYKKCLSVPLKHRIASILADVGGTDNVDAHESADNLYDSAVSSFRRGDSSNGFGLMILASKLGHVQAVRECGNLLLKGIGVASNSTIGFELIRTAAEFGDIESQYLLGKCYEDGHGCAVDRDQAFTWYEKAAKGGHIRAQVSCGDMLMDWDEDWDVCTKKAGYWYRQAAENGDAEAMNGWGVCLEGIDDKEAFRWIEMSAKKGYGWGMEELACLYYNGIGCKTDKDKAVEWWGKAAALGVANADVCLIHNCAGRIEHLGRIEEAARLYIKAGEVADDEKSYVWSDLGRLYFDGCGVAKDSCRAYGYFKRAAEMGNMNGIFGMARCFEQGIGVDRNCNEALRLYELVLDGASEETQVAKESRLAIDRLSNCNGC